MGGIFETSISARAASSATLGHPSKERAAQMAKDHEIMAKMIEARLADRTGFYWNAPPLVPADLPLAITGLAGPIYLSGLCRHKKSA
jgi:hypothetical protein